MKAQSANWRIHNKEAIALREKQYYIDNRESEKVRNKEYKINNKETYICIIKQL